ncbi:MAG: LysR family transcriptional regulator [Enterocloster bolteae]
MISKEIRYMLAIRRYGSITKAADSLFITQSALSKAVKNIERQLGSPLFSRIGNDLIPTHIGNRYMDYAEKICQICSDWNSECEDLLGEEKGQLTIAVALMRGSCLLPDVLGRFYSRYPDVQINLLEESHSVEKQLMLSPTWTLPSIIPRPRIPLRQRSTWGRKKSFWWQPPVIPWRKKPWQGKAFAIPGWI